MLKNDLIKYIEGLIDEKYDLVEGLKVILAQDYLETESGENEIAGDEYRYILYLESEIDDIRNHQKRGWLFWKKVDDENTKRKIDLVITEEKSKYIDALKGILDKIKKVDGEIGYP